MLRRLFLISVSLFFLAGCKTGMVTGTVSFKGVPCPENDPTRKVPPCNGIYPGYEVKVYARATHKIKGRGTTNETGTFSIKLKPGDYYIKTQGGITTDMTREYNFSVKKGETADVNALVDTGIQ